MVDNTLKHCTDFWKNYPDPIQKKANTLLNGLQKAGIKLENAIPFAINQTREWILENGLKFSDGQTRLREVWYMVPHETGWTIKNKTFNEAIKILDTKIQAILYGKDIAKKHGGILVVKEKDDEVQRHFAFFS